MNYCYWWKEQFNPQETQRLLVRVCSLHDEASRQQPADRAHHWRRFVDALYELLREAHHVPPADRLLMWQDSYGIRAARCGAAGPYLPPGMAAGPPDWLRPRL